MKSKRDIRRSSSSDRHRHRRRRSSSSSPHSDRHRKSKYRSERRRSRSRSNRGNYKRDKRQNNKEVFDFSDTEVDGLKKSTIKSTTEYGKIQDKDVEEVIEKELPCFEQSGILAEYSNKTQSGVVLKFTEPLDAAMPDKQWRLYVFRGEEELQTINLSKQTCYLFGRDDKVADINVDNPSCSMQHAVLQFREKQQTRELSQEEQTARGLFQGFINETVVKPYLLDLESTNKTYLNGNEIEPARYYELREQDVLKFGESQREYVLMKK